MSVFLTAEWRKLLMAQYTVEPAILIPHLPRGLELDLFHINNEERCYVSLVAFLFDRVRLKGLPIPLHTSFEEINLRFYIRCPQPDGAFRRGVVFIREFVPRRAIAFVAQRFYEEPYFAVPTGHSYKLMASSLSVEYWWKFGSRSHTFSAIASPTPIDITSGSEEEFITEHYWGYTRRSNNRTSEYEVQHPRWQMYRLSDHKIDVDLERLYGSTFDFLNDQPASSVLLAEGSPVSVSSGAHLA